MSRIYKGSKIYCCFTLNRLVSELGIDLYQEDLEKKLDEILSQGEGGLFKEEIKHEIRSNHFMTNKVIEQLEVEEKGTSLPDSASIRKAVNSHPSLFLNPLFQSPSFSPGGLLPSSLFLD